MKNDKTEEKKREENSKKSKDISLKEAISQSNGLSKNSKILMG